ncbi:protein kinase C substrate 80K-H [Entomortierella parvispora]|uniref:Glucosidase 2 subunit beta n=1 Tax=Entomortierella parvispora TaxID=205924 RepID=A0A9P3H298_9FUNG|nr:protein kinase C substrate 80K-H [Entomortierella parvispora]
MKSHSFGIPLVATLALSLAVAQATASAGTASPPRGVSPSKANLYVPDRSSQWKCLDGSKTIPFNAVNDDYCDCPDGSDEPGTSACGTGHFHCANVGHVASDIKSSRVNDGVCDPECCDGSDEYNGAIHCPNVCDEVGAEAGLERERVRAIEAEGSRLRKVYIEHGQNTKLQWTEDLFGLRERTTTVKKEATKAKEQLDLANEELDKFLEGSKATREAERRAQLKPYLEQQTQRLIRVKESKAFLEKALQDLKENYNKNYHDLAVKNTVSGFDELMGTGTVGDQEVEETEETVAATEEYQPPTADQALEGEQSPDRQFSALQDESYSIQREIGRLHDLLVGMKHEYNTEYNDEAVLKAIQIADDFEVEWDTSLNEFKGELPIDIPVEDSDDGPEAEKFKAVADEKQSAFDSASEEQRVVEEKIRDIEKKQRVDFGPDGTFVRMMDECFEFKDIEYTYSLCMFGSANQKSHSTTFLGKFSNWVGDDYNTQMYTGGTKCWNGPDRSVKLIMTCGTVNEIVSVAEPEKCEYVFKMQTPAVCAVLDDAVSNEEERSSEESVPPTSNVEPEVEVKKRDEL